MTAPTGILTTLTFTALSIISAQADTPPEQLETIEVTAQKRTQNLQQVPVAVSVVSGEALQQSVSLDIYDIQGYIPTFNAFQSQSATNSGFAIRGIGTSTQNFGFEPSVGLYVDGVYRSRQNAVINDLVDIDTIEVLRGPQGTLFGKNTPAGAVVFNTKAPTFENGDGFVTATLGSDNLRRVTGATSLVAIEDTLAFRVAGFNTDRDGWITEANSGQDINNRDRFGVRAQALYTPTDAVIIRLIADWAELDEVCCGALTWQDNQQANQIPGKSGTDALLASPLFVATVYTQDSFYDYTTALSQLPASSMQDRGLSLQADWQLNAHWALTSITAWRDFDSVDDTDSDFTDADLLTARNDARQQAFSQEVRMTYDSDLLSVMAGAYWFSQNLDLDYTITTHDDFPLFFSASAPQLNPLIDGLNGLSAATGGLIALAAPATPVSAAFFHNAYQEQDSYALFVQSDWYLATSWTLTTGLRYTVEEKSLRGRYTETGPGIDGLPLTPALQPDPMAAGAALAIVGQALAAGELPEPAQLAPLAAFQQPGWGYFLLNTAAIAPRPALDESIDDNQLTGAVKLSWQPSDHQLIFASYATGYKAGGLNTDRIAAAFDPRFEAETANSFEVGFKQDFRRYNLRLNLAAHLTDIKDFQASTFTGTGFNLQNAGDIETKGIEAELTWFATSDTRLSLNVARTLATFDEFERGPCWVAYTWHTGIDDPGRAQPDAPFCSRAADRVGFNPENTLSLQASQYIALGSLDSQLSLDWQYTGDLYMDSTNDPYKKSSSYSLLNVRWQFSLPEFNSDIIVWGRNVLDKEYVARNAFDVPVQTGKIMAYPGQPASWGITLQTYF